MLVLYAIVLGIVVGLVLGGRPENLARTRLRWVPAAIAGFAVQVAIFSGPGSAAVGDAGPALYVASTALVFVVVLRNLAITGLPLVAAGAALNVLAIVANGGSMPADPGALAAAGRAVSDGYSNSIVLANPNLRLLTDILWVPKGVPLANVFSVGDVLIAAGVAIAIAALMRRPLPGAGRAARIR